MPDPSEPENYSIDEMMERLKSHQPEGLIEDGELVTRADGSQAIRVRKRKRRTQQPHKEELQHSRRARMIQVSVTLILLMLIVFGVGVAIIIANSPAFRAKLLGKIAQSSHATVELEQFRMNPASANAQRITLNWPAGNVLQRLTLRNIRADISPQSFLGQALTGEEVSCAEGTLLLRFPQADQRSGDGLSTQEPLPIRFKRYAIADAHVLLGEPMSPLIQMRNSNASFSPVSANSRAQLLLSRGDIHLKDWPKLRLDRSHLEFRGTEVDVVSMRLRHETDNRGIFELSGTISPYANRLSTLAVRLDSYLLAGIVGPELGNLFAFSGTGRIDTQLSNEANALAFSPGPAADATLALAFHNTPTATFDLNGFPFLFGLAQTLDDDWFERPVFESNVSGVIRRMNQQVILSKLNFENKTRMTVRGTVTLAADRQLSGNLKVGVTNALIMSANSRRLDAIFGPPLDGVRWINLKIGGSVTAPTDNFKELFQTPEASTKSAASGEIPTFEELTKPK